MSSVTGMCTLPAMDDCLRGAVEELSSTKCSSSKCSQGLTILKEG